MKRTHSNKTVWAVVLVIFFVGINTSPMMSGLLSEANRTIILIGDHGLRDSNDTTPPMTTLTTDPPDPIYNGWYQGGVGVTLNATDNESGVNVTYYQINDEDWETYLNTFWLGMEGINLMEFYSIDNAGNEEIQKEEKIKIDATPPILYYFLDPVVPDGLNGWYVNGVWLTLNATDNESGVKCIYCSASPGGIYTEPVLITEGLHPIKISAIDNVGNILPEMSIPPLKIDMTAPSITMNYTWEGNPWCGYIITITVICTDALSGMARVEFYFNGILQETITGEGPEYSWSFEYSILPSIVIKGIAYDEAGNSDYSEIVDPTSYEDLQNQSQSQTIEKKVNL